MSERPDERDVRAARSSIEQDAEEKKKADLGQRPSGALDEPHRLGRFVILEHLGRGGMGIVYSAYDPVLDRRVALKLLRPQPGRDAERMRARLHREAQALARLSHPNVVPVYDVGIIDGEVFIVMEFVIGQTLRAWAHDRPWHDVMAMYLQVARGLAAAHAVGLVHRDVKPDNVVVGKDGRPRVLDFGLVRDIDFDSGVGAGRDLGARAVADSAADRARVRTADLGELDTLRPETTAAAGRAEPMVPAPVPGQAREDLTATNAIMGTPAYMAPEQHGSASIGPAADQFSFCVALYEALYGQLPFDVRAVSDRLADLRAARALGVAGEAHVSHPDPIEPPAGAPVPDAFWAILRRGLARDPAERWPGMDALIEALAGKLAGFDQTLAEPGVQRFPQIVFAILGGIAALLLGSAIYLSSAEREPEAISMLWATVLHTTLSLACVALLVYARTRWKRVKQLHRLIGTYGLCAAGAVVHDVVSLLTGRPFFQTMLAIVPMFIVIFVFASLAYARWMAWIASLFAVGLVLLLALPSHFMVWSIGATGLGWIVVLAAWRRMVRKHGVAAAGSSGSRGSGASSSRLRAT